MYQSVWLFGEGGEGKTDILHGGNMKKLNNA